MYVLTKVISGYEGDSVEVITASENLNSINALETVYNFKLKHDLDVWENLKNVLHPQFLIENPQPPANFDMTEEERMTLIQWRDKNNLFLQTFKEDNLYYKESSCSTLEATYYEVTEVRTPENLLKELSATL